MTDHVAITLPRYIHLILQGRKTIETRLSRQPIAPYHKITPGDRIYFKASAGPYMATALASEVFFFANLTPARIRTLRQLFNHAVCAEPAYWQNKSTSRYATFIFLDQVCPARHGPALSPSRGLAWFVLPGPSSSCSAPPPSIHHAHELVIPLTLGSIRNAYLRCSQLSPGPLELLLPDGRRIQTLQTPHHLIRWRGWRRYYEAWALSPGDQVVLIPLAARRFKVNFLHTTLPN